MNVTPVTKKYRKVKTVDGTIFQMHSTYHHNDTNELMALVIDSNGKSHEFYAVELKLV